MTKKVEELTKKISNVINLSELLLALEHLCGQWTLIEILQTLTGKCNPKNYNIDKYWQTNYRTAAINILIRYIYDTHVKIVYLKTSETSDDTKVTI